jgi:hypothetical protein
MCASPALLAYEEGVGIKAPRASGQATQKDLFDIK